MSFPIFEYIYTPVHFDNILQCSTCHFSLPKHQWNIYSNLIFIYFPEWSFPPVVRRLSPPLTVLWSVLLLEEVGLTNLCSRLVEHTTSTRPRGTAGQRYSFCKLSHILLLIQKLIHVTWRISLPPIILEYEYSEKLQCKIIKLDYTKPCFVVYRSKLWQSTYTFNLNVTHLKWCLFN